MKIGIQTWGSEGDIRPFFALAGGLAEAGNTVTLAAAGVKEMDFGMEGRAPGFHLLDLGYVEYTEDQLLQIGSQVLEERNPLKQIHAVLNRFFYPLADKMMDASNRLCEENELLIRHFMVYPLGIAADRDNRPCVSVFTTPPPVPSKYSSPVESINLGGWINTVLWKAADRTFNRLFMPPINLLRKREGLSPIQSVMKQSWASDVLNLIAISPTLIETMPDWEGRFSVCGFLDIPSRDDTWPFPEDLTRFLHSGPPPIYMTFGSMMEGDPAPAEITKLLSDTAIQEGCRAIIQSRWEAVHNLPDHPDIYRISRAPHCRVFPHCAAVVHAGGTGTVQSAILAGCPSVIVAHASDQMRWGMMLNKAGLSPKALHRRSLTAAKLARAIRTVLENPDFKKRAEELSEQMRKENGLKKAIESIHNRFDGER